jgi:hypothetical protein
VHRPRGYCVQPRRLVGVRFRRRTPGPDLCRLLGRLSSARVDRDVSGVRETCTDSEVRRLYIRSTAFRLCTAICEYGRIEGQVPGWCRAAGYRAVPRAGYGEPGPRFAVSGHLLDAHGHDHFTRAFKAGRPVELTELLLDLRPSSRAASLIEAGKHLMQRAE